MHKAYFWEDKVYTEKEKERGKKRMKKNNYFLMKFSKESGKVIDIGTLKKRKLDI